MIVHGLMRKALVLSGLASGLFVSGNAHANYYWRPAVSCLKAVVTTDLNGVTNYALSCTASGLPGNYQIKQLVKNDIVAFPYWQLQDDPLGGAATSITMKDGRLYAISSDHTVWYKTGSQWVKMPTNKYEGGSITLRQQVGDRSIAVGDPATPNGERNVWVVESGNVKNTLRWFNGTSWFRLPELPSSVKEVAIWYGESAGQRIRPWVVTEDQKFYHWNTSDQWELVANGTGLGVSNYYVIGSDGTSRWTYSYTNHSFSQSSTDTAWSNGAINYVEDLWLIGGNGQSYHWEPFTG